MMSSTTTYTIAPAANANEYGNNGSATWTRRKNGLVDGRMDERRIKEWLSIEYMNVICYLCIGYSPVWRQLWASHRCYMPAICILYHGNTKVCN